MFIPSCVYPLCMSPPWSYCVYVSTVYTVHPVYTPPCVCLSVCLFLHVYVPFAYICPLRVCLLRMFVPSSECPLRVYAPSVSMSLHVFVPSCVCPIRVDAPSVCMSLRCVHSMVYTLYHMYNTLYRTYVSCVCLYRVYALPCVRSIVCKILYRAYPLKG